MEKTKIAIFVDVENLTQWVKEDGLERLVNDLSSAGRIVTRKAYGVWSSPHILKLQAPLNRLGFDLVHSFHPVSGKNSADIQLTMDVLENAIKARDIEQIVLATGDSDFSPLFRRLREMGKEVIGVGPRSPLSECVKSSCTRYVYTDKSDERETAYELSEAVALVEKFLGESDEPVHLGALKHKLMLHDNAFDERNWEYNNFLSFLNDIESVNAYQEPDKTHWLCQLKAQPEILEKNNNQAADTSTYRQFLRTMNWPFVPQSIISKLRQELLQLPPMELADIKETLIQQTSSYSESDLMAGFTATDIRKAITVYMKAQLFTNYDAKKVQLEPTNEYLEVINQAISERVQAACSLKKVDYNLKQLEPLLYTTEDGFTPIFRTV